MISLWRRSHPLVRASVVACVVAFAHLLVEAGAWMEWDKILRPGEVPRMPALWPVVSFPAFPAYEALTGGDRAMFDTFWWVMLGNSALWGVAAGIAYRMLSARRPRTQVREAA